jgi:hypothetical protein
MRPKSDILTLLRHNIDYLRDIDIDDRVNVINTMVYVVDNLTDIATLIDENLMSKGDRLND